MDLTKFSIGTLIGTIAYFFLGWLVYGILLAKAMELPADIRDVVAYPAAQYKISNMALSCLFWGALLSYIFTRWANISTFMGGVKAGAVIGILTSLTVGFGMAAQYKFGTIQNAFIDAAANAVCSGLAGGVIGWYLGRK